MDESTSSKSGCNIVLANRLVQTEYDKKKYQRHLKVVFLVLVIFSQLFIVVVNPLGAIGVALNKHKLMYNILAPSIIAII